MMSGFSEMCSAAANFPLISFLKRLLIQFATSFLAFL